MIDYAISQPPPSRQQLEAEKSRLTVLKQQQFKASIFSDAIHGACFLTLYLTGQLSGYGLLLAIGLATLVAVVVASASKKQLRSTGIVAVVLTAMVTATLVGAGSLWWLQEAFAGAVLGGIASGSIVIAGAVIGRKFMHVFTGLEQLKHVAEDEYLLAELQVLCRTYPQCEDYRQQALDILRPNLVVGELQAMQLWVAANTGTINTEA